MLLSLSHTPNVEIVEIPSFQDYNSLPRKNCPKSGHSIPPHPHDVKIVENQSLQDHNFSHGKIVQNQTIQDYHILQTWKLFKQCPFKTTTPSQSKKDPKLVLSRPSHPPNVNAIKNHSFQDHHTLSK